MIIVKIFVLIGSSCLVKSKNVYMHNLPLGEYRTVFEKLYPCQSLTLNQFHLYYNKKAYNVTELKGNFTFLNPFDDSYTLDVNAASWSLIGGWKPNSMVYVAKKACSSLKMFAGNAWYTVLKAFNITKTSCPILPGTYVTSGMNLKNVEEDHNFPKVYFYGKYKVSFKIKNYKNEIITCYICELSLIRPWENPI
ncbi:uncharacterized protein LOC113554528 [Rhopalosiphum maidis]|uniref:uncharacterized protein LOC113554528 n=1 Tax=Rhopalosiphum maidis TaxID=43146 RepID=UPI000F00421D|nr:uncharacterized protein LOC113554528 [Rhopalosiphum maidis]